MGERGSGTVWEIIEQAERLSLEDQLYLITVLAERARNTQRARAGRREWKEICGSAPYPQTGEDAQVWVSRARQEGDEVWARLEALGEEIARNWEGEKSAVEILAEIRR